MRINFEVSQAANDERKRTLETEEHEKVLDQPDKQHHPTSPRADTARADGTRGDKLSALSTLRNLREDQKA